MNGMTDSPAPEEYLQHRAWLASLARTLVGDPSSADDLVQQTWIAALTRPPRNSAALRGWLATVLRNENRQRIRGEVRRRAREGARPERRAQATPEEVAQRAETQRRVLGAVQRLAPIYRDAVLLRHFEELPLIDVAGRLGVPLETARTRLKRGVALLRQVLDDEYGDRRAWMVALTPIAADGARETPHDLTGSRTISHLAVGLVAGSVLLLSIAASVAVLGSGPDDAVVSGTAPAVDVDTSRSRSEATRSEREHVASATRLQITRDARAHRGGPTEVEPFATIPVAHRMSVRVRNVFDGASVPDLRAEFVLAGVAVGQPRRVPLASSEAGDLALPATADGTLRLRDGPYRLVIQSLADIRRTQEVWVHQEVRFSGVVEEEGPLSHNLTSVTLGLRMTGLPDLPPHIVRRMGRGRSGAMRPTIDGLFSVSLPLLPNCTIVASGAVWRDEVWALEAPRTPDGGVSGLRFVMRRAPRVAGVVRDVDGVPIAGASIVEYRPVRNAEFDSSVLQHGLSDARGAFAFRLRASQDGDVLLLVTPPAPFRVAHRLLRASRGDVASMAIELDRAPLDGRVTVLLDDAPDPSLNLVLRDVTDARFPIPLTLHFDDDSSADPRLLTPGRRYVAVRCVASDQAKRGVWSEGGSFVWNLGDSIRLFR